MKKITLTLAVAFLSLTATAQTDLINRPAGDSGLISTQGNDGTAVYTADYFELTSDTNISELDVFGFGSVDVESGGAQTFADNVTGFNVWIFNDNNGVPDGDPASGNEVIKLENIDPSNYSLIDGEFLTIDLTAANGGTQLNLTAGSYWISTFPSVNTAPAGDGRWNWIGSDVVTDYEGKIIDPNDLFGAGLTSWTDVSAAIGEPFNTFAWILRDEVLAVAGNTMSDFNHYVSANQVLNINAQSAMSNVSVFNLLGQQVINENVSNKEAKINLNALNSGVYLVQVQVEGKSKSFKIVKK